MKIELLRLNGITKNIGGNKILDDFNLCIFAGELLFLFGLSNSGIDEITEIIIGNLEPDKGSIKFRPENGSDNYSLLTKKKGIHYIRESCSVVPEFTVAENLDIFENQNKKSGLINKSKIEKKAKKILSDLHIDIAPNTLCSNLSAFQQLLVEIIRCEQMGIKLIISNDFNMNFTMDEYSLLNKTMEYMSKKGMSFLLCMHSYNEWGEMFPSAERYIVMRNGRKVCTLYSDDYKKSDIVSLMTGREYIKNYKRKDSKKSEVILRTSNLSDEVCLKDVSFELSSGEVMGLLDLSGRMNSDIASILTGYKNDFKGQISLSGKETIIRNPKNAIKKGISYIPGNAVYSSMLPESMNVAENLSLLLMKKHLLNKIFIDNKLINIVYYENSKELGLAGVSPNTEIDKIDPDAKLRLIYMRWILAKPKVLICLNPTYKLDMLMKGTVYQMLDKATKQGIGVLLLTSDPVTATTMCDRVAILSEGYVKGFFDKEDLEKIDLSLI